MPIFATDLPRLSALIKNYDAKGSPELFNDLVNVNEASAVTYALGQVLGKQTSTGNYIISKQAATDGSQVACAVYIGNYFGSVIPTNVAASTNTNVLALVRGKVVVAASALVLDASINTPTLVAATYAQLKAVGILAEVAN